MNLGIRKKTAYNCPLVCTILQTRGLFTDYQKSIS